MRSVVRTRFLSALALCAVVGAGTVSVAPLAQAAESSTFKPSHDAPPPPNFASPDAEHASSAAPSPTQANQGPDSPTHLNAVLYQLGSDLRRPILIQIFDDSDENIAIATALKDALTASGYRVVDGPAPLHLSFEMSGQADGVAIGDQSVLQIQGRNDPQGGNPRYQAHVGLYSSEKNSLVGGENGAAGSSSFGPSVRFQVSLSDSASGKRLWDGWATGPVGQQGGAETARQMAPSIVAAIGETLREQPIQLPAVRR